MAFSFLFLFFGFSFDPSSMKLKIPLQSRMTDCSCLDHLFFFDRKVGVLLKETKVYITLVATLGVSPKAARSLIYDTTTKVGQSS